MTAFRFKSSLVGLKEEQQRPFLEQFKAIQNDLDANRPRPSSVPFTGRSTTAQVGGLLLLSPPESGVLVGIPPGTPENITKTLRIAVVGGVLSPGATVSIVGGKGTINGQQTLILASFRLVELVSCGPLGWFYST